MTTSEANNHLTQGRVMVLPTRPPLDSKLDLDQATPVTLSGLSLEELQRQALALFALGQGVGQVATTLGIRGHLVRQWMSQSRTAPLGDGRKWYDDSFKANALAELASGISVRQLARQLSLSELTLHKWKKEVSAAHRATPGPSFSGELQPGLPSGVPVDIDSLSDQLVALQNQVRVLVFERDVLKKAMVILLRSDTPG